MGGRLICGQARVLQVQPERVARGLVLQVSLPVVRQLVVRLQLEVRLPGVQPERVAQELALQGPLQLEVRRLLEALPLEVQELVVQVPPRAGSRLATARTGR